MFWMEDNRNMRVKIENGSPYSQTMMLRYHWHAHFEGGGGSGSGSWGRGVYWYDLVRPGARLSAPVVPVIPWCIRLTRIFHHVC